jgi:hypothetical protein
MFENMQGQSWGSQSGWQRFNPAHEAFLADLQRAWPSPQSTQAISDAFAAYAAIVQEPWASPELQRRAADAYAVYIGRMREAFASGRADQVIAAYRRYVEHIKRLWADVDPDALTPADLGAIAQGMAWVAGIAFGVAPNAVPPADPRSQP